MAKQLVYLDTSVLSALHDDDAPQRQADTRRFWARLSSIEACTSTVCVDEIGETPNPDRRRVMLESLKALRVFSITEGMRQLAQRYIEERVFTGRMENDALHVAASVIERCEVLLSWNFKHLVNRRRRAAVNMLNQAAKLPTIEIIAPPEL